MSELVDVAGGIALGEVATVIGAGQGRFDGAHLFRRHAAPRQTAFGKQARDQPGMLETGLVAVDVQDALLLQVEVDAFGFRPGEQMLARGDGQTRGFDGVLPVIGDRADELGEPGELVPAGLGIDQQRRIALEHPLEALDDGRPVVPDLGIGGRQLAAVGERGFHRRVAVLFQQGDREAALGQGIGGGDAGDTATDDCDCFHCCRSRTSGGHSPCAQRAAGAPSVLDLRDSRARDGSLAPSVRPATKTGRLFRVSAVIAVLLPESFRGGCSFGAAMRQSLPQSHRFVSAPAAAFCRDSKPTLPENATAVTPTFG